MSSPAALDKFDCYELCVQSPRHITGFLRMVHGGRPVWLREDFAGTGAIARRWVEDGRREGEKRFAVAVDSDPETIERARRASGAPGLSEAVHLILGNATDRPLVRTHGCDIIFVGNFSIGYIHDRAALGAYLRRSRERLGAGHAGVGGGVFVCDTYGGPSAFKEGSTTRLHPGRGRESVRYTWEHRDTDSLSGMVTNAIHFQVEIDGDVVARYPDAFVYRWRLWSVPELREAMAEAGFATVEVYQDVGPHAAPVTHGRDLRESGIVCLVARAG